MMENQYEYTNDWFVGHQSTWDNLIPQLNKLTKILEVGCYEGRSTCYLIQKCSDEYPIELHCVDTWEGGVEHDKSVMNTVEMRFNKNTAIALSNTKYPVTLIKHKTYSYLACAKLLANGQQETFDLIYIDGSHQASDVLTDAVLAFQLLRVGGVLIFDDYLWSMEPNGQQDILNMPKSAIDAFFSLFQRKIKILPGFPLYQLYSVKTAN